VVEVDVVNASLSTGHQLTFPTHQRQHRDDDDDDDDEVWKKSLGFIRLSGSNLANTSTPGGKFSAC